MERFDTTKPNIARLWDYWLGGRFSEATEGRKRALRGEILPSYQKAVNRKRASSFTDEWQAAEE